MKKIFMSLVVIFATVLIVVGNTSVLTTGMQRLKATFNSVKYKQAKEVTQESITVYDEEESNKALEFEKKQHDDMYAHSDPILKNMVTAGSAKTTLPDPEVKSSHPVINNISHIYRDVTKKNY